MASSIKKSMPVGSPVPAMDMADYKTVKLKRSVTINEHFYGCKFAQVVNADVLKAMQDLGVVVSVSAA